MSNYAEKEDFVDVRVLGGEDGSREAGEIVVQLVGGVPHNLYGDVIEVDGHTTLVGWGDMDGPAFTLSNGVIVPKAEWPWVEQA